MQKTSLRLPAWQIDSLDAIATEAEATNRSELIRDAISKQVQEHKDEAPQWAVAESAHDRKRRQNRPRLREMHFKQRIHEYARDCLFDDLGRMKRHPPSPSKFRAYYGEMVREEVKDEYPENEDEYIEHLEETLDWYELMHPDASIGGPKQQAIALVRHHMEHENRDSAREIAEQSAQNTDATKHELLDEARERKADTDWRHQWDEAVRPWVTGTGAGDSA